MKTLHLTIWAGAVAVFLTGAPLLAQAQGDYQSNGTGGGLWSNTSSWECYDSVNGWEPCATKPGANDTATILAGDTITIRNTAESIGELTIEDDNSTPGELEIESGSSAGGSSLQFSGNGDPPLTMQAVDTYPGRITFADGTSMSYPGRLILNTNVTATGEIICSASNDGCEITTNSTYCLTLRGAPAEVQVSGGDLTFDGCFDNDATLTVSTANTFESKGSGAAAGSAGDWIIEETSNGTIKFNQDNALTVTATGGKLDLRDGKLDIDQSLTFQGALEWLTDAEVDVATSKQLEVCHGSCS